MSQANLSQPAFWLYGVIVGLAIRDALELTVPNILSRTEGVDPIPLLLRLLLFLMVTVRFYFGAVVFFNDVYGPDGAANYKKKSFGLDFLSGFAHFILFYIWALSIDPKRPVEWFVTILATVLLYDLVWFWACLEYDTHHRMKLWTAINVGTVVLGGFVYVLGLYVLKLPFSLAEELAFIPVALVSVIDIAEITTGRPKFAEWLANLVTPFRQE